MSGHVCKMPYCNAKNVKFVVLLACLRIQKFTLLLFLSVSCMAEIVFFTLEYMDS